MGNKEAIKWKFAVLLALVFGIGLLTVVIELGVFHLSLFVSPKAVENIALLPPQRVVISVKNTLFIYDPIPKGSAETGLRGYSQKLHWNSDLSKVEYKALGGKPKGNGLLLRNAFESQWQNELQIMRQRLQSQRLPSDLDATETLRNEALILAAFHTDVLHPTNSHAISNSSSNSSYTRPSHLIRMPGFTQTCLKSGFLRLKGKSHRRFLSVDIAGLYNAGTNALRKSVDENCHRIAFANSFLDGLFEVGIPPWGKHIVLSAPEFKDTRFWLPMKHPLNRHLVVVAVRDPLTWIKAVCRVPYDIYFKNPTVLNKTLCPRGVVRTNVTIDYSGFTMQRLGVDPKSSEGRKLQRQHQKVHFKSPVEVWNKYHSLYLNSAFEFGVVFVRFEDFLSATVPLIQSLCFECLKVGRRFKAGAVLPPFAIFTNTAKSHGSGHDRNTALLSRLDPTSRFSGYSSEDLRWVHQNINHTLLAFFGYQFDI